MKAKIKIMNGNQLKVWPGDWADTTEGNIYLDFPKSSEL